MEAYCKAVRALEDKFYGIELNHVPRRYNEEADELAKITSGRITVPPNVFARDIAQPSVVLEPHPSRHAEPSGAPSNPAGAEPMDEDPSNEVYVLSLLEGYGANEAEAMDVEPAPVGADWRDKYVAWLGRGELPSDRSEARRIARMAKSFALVDGELYKRAASGILQRCVPIPEGRELLRDIHAGICGHHTAPAPSWAMRSVKAFTGPWWSQTPARSCAPAKGANFTPEIQPPCSRPADHPHNMAFRCVGTGHCRAPAEGARGLHPLVGCNRQIFQVGGGAPHYQPQG
jgi:hypothetical protein